MSFVKTNKKIEELPWIPLGYPEWTTLSSKWNLKDKLFKFSPVSRSFTLDMAFRGIKIYGSNGSGKTSGFSKVIASSYLDHGFGGLVLCAKGDNDEWNNWTNLSKEVGRSKSLIHFGPKNKDQNLSFNILEFIRTLSENKNESQANLVKILKIISNDLQGGSLSSTDSFWDGVTDQYLTHLLSLTMCIYKNEELTFRKLLITFKQIQGNLDLLHVLKQLGIDDLMEDLEKAIDFFKIEFPSLNEKTRSVIEASVSSLLFKFNSGLLSKLFGREGNIDPRWTFSGALIVVNIPTHEYQEIGKTANLIWKYAFQKACLCRKMNKGFMRPVFLWADEAQEFIHPDDVKFQATARSSRCATVYLTQNIAGLRFGLGSGAKAQDAIKAIESNLLTTIFHQNIDSETNKYASDIIGTKKEKVKTSSSKGFFSSEVSENISFKEVPIFKQETFLNLKTGGHSNSKIVEAIVFAPGARLFFDWEKFFKFDFFFRDWQKIRILQGSHNGLRVSADSKLAPNFERVLGKA